MNKTKRLLMLLLLVCGMAVGTWAQNAVKIYQLDGKAATFAFTERPVVTYSGNELVLTSTKTTVTYPIYKLKKLVFDVEWDETTSVELETNKNPGREGFRFLGDVLQVMGGEPNSPVLLYNIKGIKVGEYRLDSDGNTAIPLSSLNKDFYIVKAKGITFKFRKS